MAIFFGFAAGAPAYADPPSADLMNRAWQAGAGNCADIGKMKRPILRGLASRAPYFHNGAAATLLDVVNFYDQRFGIGFTEQQKQDLVAFLNTL